jgi:hypothetical protein
MACLRLTLIEPKAGSMDEMQTVLTLLDQKLAREPGLIFSFVTEVEADKLGRIALWQSKEDANHVAMREDVLALRARLRALALNTEETLMELRSGNLPEPLSALVAGDAVSEPVAFNLGAVA